MVNVDRDLERVLGSFDAEWSQMYRQQDAVALENGGVFDHYGKIVSGLCNSFGRSIDVLDVGCGTGRYFHCLQSVERLVGTDLSAHMLAQAKNPIHAANLRIGSIELKCGDLATLSLKPASFDLIYSIGVYGEYTPIGEDLIELFVQLLKPGGKFFATAVDASSRVSVPEHSQPSFVRRVVRKLFPVLPPFARIAINRKLSPHYVTKQQIERIGSSPRLLSYQVTEYVHTAGWLGTHFDCLGVKR